jgi:hypothetical protein
MKEQYRSLNTKNYLQICCLQSGDWHLWHFHFGVFARVFQLVSNGLKDEEDSEIYLTKNAINSFLLLFFVEAQIIKFLYQLVYVT